MKKIIASAVVAIATLSASQAAVFNGASAGLTVGAHLSRNNARYTVNHSVQGRLLDEKAKLNRNFGTFGIHFDYDRSAANAFYWGMGLDLMFYSGAKAKKSEADDAVQTKIKYNWSSEVDARFGYNFCNNVAAYALAGLRVYNKEIKLIDTDDNSTVEKYKKTRLAPVIGLGTKFKVTNNISLGAEYRFAFEKNHKKTQSLNLGNATAHEKAELRQNSHSILAKVSYHF